MLLSIVLSIDGIAANNSRRKHWVQRTSTILFYTFAHVFNFWSHIKTEFCAKSRLKLGTKTNYVSRFQDHFAVAGEVPKFIFPFYCAGVLWREFLLVALNKVQDLFQIMKVCKLTNRGHWKIRWNPHSSVGTHSLEWCLRRIISDTLW